KYLRRRAGAADRGADPAGGDGREQRARQRDHDPQRRRRVGARRERVFGAQRKKHSDAEHDDEDQHDQIADDDAGRDPDDFHRPPPPSFRSCVRFSPSPSLMTIPPAASCSRKDGSYSRSSLRSTAAQTKYSPGGRPVIEYLPSVAGRARWTRRDLIV